MPATDEREAARRSTEPVRQAEHHLPPLSDPGKDDRAAHGIPVVPSFDGYRAFAILGIVAAHLIGASRVVGGTGNDWGDQLMNGIAPWLVGVLFIVSGFVVFMPTVARGGNFGAIGPYAIRRASRLMPAYWLTLLIMLLIIGLQPDFPLPTGGELAINFAGQDQIATFFDDSFHTGLLINGPIWTLTLEIGFYIILPFIASAYFRRPLIGLLAAALISVTWKLAFAHLTGLASLVGSDISGNTAQGWQLGSDAQLPSWAFAFGAGMTGAWAYVTLPQRFDRAKVERLARAALIAAIAAIVLVAYLASRSAIGNNLIAAGLISQRDPLIFIGYVGAIATAMVALALTPGHQRPFAEPLVRKLGDISYGVFLIHAVVVWVLLSDLLPTPDASFGSLAVITSIALPICLAYGYLSARFLEQPIRRWARRFGRRQEAPDPSRKPDARLTGSAAGGDAGG